MDHMHAVVLGASGLVGQALVAHLKARADWRVTGVSRKASTLLPHRQICVDLTDREATHEALASLDDTTHVFYAARVGSDDVHRDAVVNTRMLVNVVDALLQDAKRLEHVCLVHGTKWYGSHAGPFRTPARESDPRHFPPNFYFDQHDFITARQKGEAWTWSTVRPHTVCGVTRDYPYNLFTGLAAYASICKELQLPLYFPGAVGAYSCIAQATDAGLLARAMHWIATNPACANQDFNVTNGDLFRWSNLWDSIAHYFGMESGPVRTVKLSLTMSQADKIWDRIVSKYQLAEPRLSSLVNWSYLDFHLHSAWDSISSPTKLRQFGFQEVIDSEEMIFKIFDKLRHSNMIPPRE